MTYPARVRARCAPARGRLAAALLLACAAGPALADDPARTFAFDDIHFWVGEGTNRMAVIVDWNQGEGTSLAWGYRWNGDAVPMAHAIAEIAREDNRLRYFSSQTKLGTSVDGFGYDRSDVAAAFDAASATATDADALFGVYARPRYWAQSPGKGADFASVAWTYGAGVDNDLASDGAWYCFKHADWVAEESSEPVATPVAAESPYGWRVVAADVLPGGDYGDPANALGAPSRTVPGWGSIPPTTVNPASPAWGPGRLVTLEAESDDTGGSITIEFDHPVADDPRNPFGLDFIVFGNALHGLGGNAYFDGVSDPAGVRFGTASVGAERGLVEVSADGAAWFPFSDGPWADDFAPTMAFRYDPQNPDRALFGGSAYANEWWGAPADATRPVDPALSAADFQGRTLADYATLYDGSAGGTGFDISGFDLPRDAKGRKWIRFVRITTLDPEAGDNTEVDAVSDVAPAPSFRNWVDAHFAFAERPGVTKGTACANGNPAYVNAALGLAPDAPDPGAWAIGGFDARTRTLTAPLAPHAGDLVRLRSSADLSADAADWDASLPLWTGTNALGRPLLRVQGAAADDAAPAAFFRLELHE